MKKKILALAVAVVTLFSVGAVAQSPNNCDKAKCQKTEKCDALNKCVNVTDKCSKDGSCKAVCKDKCCKAACKDKCCKAACKDKCCKAACKDKCSKAAVCKAKCKGEKKKCSRDAFAGLNLSESQKTKLKAITPPGQVMKEARKRGLDKGIDPVTYAKTVRADYLKQVKGVLSGDQYEQFLENMYVSQRGDKCARHHGQMSPKHGKCTMQVQSGASK